MCLWMFFCLFATRDFSIEGFCLQFRGEEKKEKKEIKNDRILLFTSTARWISDFFEKQKLA